MEVEVQFSSNVLTTVMNLGHVAQGFITTIEDAMLNFANNCTTAI